MPDRAQVITKPSLNHQHLIGIFGCHTRWGKRCDQLALGPGPDDSPPPLPGLIG